MNQIQTPTVTPVLPEQNRQHTQTTRTHLLPLPELVDPPQPTHATFIPNEIEAPGPFTFSQKNLATATPRPVQWLWQHRLPLAGITLLDGDHGTGKTLLAHQIAAAVSSGCPMPDGTPTIQGGVIIITPNTDPSTTQLQRLIALGADLSRIQILSFIHDPASSPHPSGSRPFSLPEDLPRLFDTIDQVDARLIILDPFIHTLSHQRRCTNHHLNHLLVDLNQRLIERNIACLLVRNCPTKGGHARPSALERSDDFPTIAVSRLLLAPDPIDPDCILLSHALSRHAALTPTLTLHIQPLPSNPNLAHFTIDGTHRLTATHLLTQRPDTLHRHLLSQHLYAIIARSTEPVAAPILFAQSPHSSPFQIQRSLKDLLQTGQILQPTHGFYSPNPTASTQLDATDATTPALPEAPKLNITGAITSASIEDPKLNVAGAITSALSEAPKLNVTDEITSASIEIPKLKATGAITSASIEDPKLKATGAITLALSETPKLKVTGAITSAPIEVPKLKVTGAITSAPTEAPKLNVIDAITPASIETPKLNTTGAITLAPIEVPKLKATGAITPTPTAPPYLKAPAATKLIPTEAPKLKASAAITSNTTIPTKLKATGATTPNPGTLRPHKHPSKQKKWHGRPGQSKKRS